MIRHTVAFKLKHAPGSQAELDFLQTARELATIPTVKQFECLRQISKKNSYAFGLSMEFASPQDYQIYNDHPDHVHFVQTRWIPEVVDFVEIDYEPISWTLASVGESMAGAPSTEFIPTFRMQGDTASPDRLERGV
jgi:hypothetical protein